MREGEGEPLVLLHGILCSERAWGRTIPELAGEFDVIAPTMLGHRGGRAPASRPAANGDLVDDVERDLDELGLDRVHLAGNSLGGWVALELARRGRARSVCALSPAGAWDASGGEDLPRVAALLRAAVRETRRSRRLLPLRAFSPRYRHRALANSVAHGERVSRAEVVAGADDAIECTAFDDLLRSDAALAPLDPPPCPIVLAWSGEDRIFPVDLYGPKMRELVPGAEFRVLEGVGHIPMADDPRLVAETIRATAAKAPSTAPGASQGRP
jgi:pimeloyl-ACP methyl ester carboxylesterase